MIGSNIKRSLRQLLLLILVVSFLVSFITGIIKVPELQRFFISIYGYFSASDLSRLHDYSGLVFVVLIIIHLVINKRALFAWWAPVKSKLRDSRTIRTVIVSALAIAIIVIAVFFFYGQRSRPAVLSGVEVTEYNGEKLGSIKDFRENSIKGPQYVNKNTYRLVINGLVATSTSYSYEDILKLPAYQKVVTLNCVEGWSVKVLWEGVLVKDLLKDLTIKPGAKAIIFYAADGYSTSFPLDYVMNNNIILADRMNGVLLPPERGFPFQLVAEQKWGYKWIKWVTRIELSGDTNYKGFWESRGYNNDGSLNQSKYAN